VQLASLTPGFKHLLDDLKNPENKEIWEKVMEAENPSEEKLPNSVDVRLDTFQKLLLLKILREEKLILSIKFFVLNTLGQMFI
jgi:dynein heavy chain